MWSIHLNLQLCYSLKLYKSSHNKCPLILLIKFSCGYCYGGLACQNGTFGHKCQFNCSGNCLNGEVCQITNGSCSACVDGYQGAKCFNSMLLSCTISLIWDRNMQKIKTT